MIIDNIFESERLLFKTLEASDAYGPYSQWVKDGLVTQFLESRHNSSTQDELRKYIENKNNSNNELLLGIYLKSGKHIGNIKIGPISFYNKNTFLGIMIGDKSEWGKGFATEAIATITKFALCNYNLLCIRAGAYSNNIGSIKVFIKAGYVEEGRYHKFHRFGTDFIDKVVLAYYACSNFM